MPRIKKGSGRGRSVLAASAAVLLLGVAILVAVLGDGLSSGPCLPGFGGGLFGRGGSGSASPEVEELLEKANFGASAKAAGDLEAGVVDPRLVSALDAASEGHRICVDAFKEGHYFLPGVPDGPLIPDGYGEAGGLPNTHYYGRAADIRAVDGKPVRGNGDDPDILDVGEILAAIPPQHRPDQIIGPPNWTDSLGRSRREGWIADDDQTKLHEDHLHIGFTRDDGTANTR